MCVCVCTSLKFTSYRNKTYMNFYIGRKNKSNGNNVARLDKQDDILSCTHRVGSGYTSELKQPNIQFHVTNFYHISSVKLLSVVHRMFVFDMNLKRVTIIYKVELIN